ncbi:MAG: methylmalonyl-CoA mutase [Syntrophobacterales bacterium CG_4_8_14_3_um_filter_49_14]|nr:MAG: methylmalonyl-CoA mutase [Syntrophobacterales bacterium CG23_combo_of_CG06-09_8_20_14_all_48_27]PJC73451.1 MAG: methylmalonyl-CoA mutase [Syntrophobacterales bacterium CG_4_8_14_3_um_filter_49_14]
MFKKEFLEEEDKLRAEWKESYDKLYKGKEFQAATDSGIQVKSVYTARDLEEVGFKPEMPGGYPYTRGIYPVQYQFTPWFNNLVLGYGLPEQTRERMDLLKEMGARGYFGKDAYNLVFDLVAKAGYDPDDPEVKGRVGHAGCHFATQDDFDYLFHDIDLTKVSVVHNICRATLVQIALYVAYLEKRGIPITKVYGNSMNWLWSFAFVGNVAFPSKSAFKLMAEFIKFCCRNMPQWNHTNIVSYYVEESGGNAIQEAGFAIAAGIAITEECIKTGLEPDEFLPRVGFQIAQAADFFEEIAKVRAMRRVWAKVNRERFGCKNPRSLHLRMHSQTSGVTLTAQQPLNNVVRTTLETLGAVLSGTNSIQTNSYLEALSTPTEESHILALRTQQIILHETNIPNVSDPLAGSYYVEWLTSKMEEEIFRVIEQIDKMGGFVKCWESGWFKEEITKSAYEWREKIDRGEKIIVGLNKYVTEKEQKVPVFKYPEIEEEALRRLKEYKEKRDNEKLKGALQRLREIAVLVNETWPEHSGELMPAVIEAAKAEATLGELQGILREVFGWA